MLPNVEPLAPVNFYIWSSQRECQMAGTLWPLVCQNRAYSIKIRIAIVLFDEIRVFRTCSCENGRWSSDCKPKAHGREICQRCRKKYMLGTVFYGPTHFLFFGLRIIQASDMAVSIHGNSKLNTLRCFPIDQYRRKLVDEALNEIETQAFRSVNSSIGCSTQVGCTKRLLHQGLETWSR